jgi:hypothetical protein
VATHKTSIHPFPAQERALKPNLLDPRKFAREAAAVTHEFRQAILTCYLPDDEPIGRLRAPFVVAGGRSGDPAMTSGLNRVAFYARVSTSNGQQDPEMQLRELREYAVV